MSINSVNETDLQDDSRVVGWQWRNARGHWEQCTATGSVNYRDAGFKVRPTVPLSLLAEAESRIAELERIVNHRDESLHHSGLTVIALQSRLEQEQASLQFVQAKLDAVDRLSVEFDNQKFNYCANAVREALGGELGNEEVR